MLAQSESEARVAKPRNPALRQELMYKAEGVTTPEREEIWGPARMIAE